jgi:glutamine amidotransferase
MKSKKFKIAVVDYGVGNLYNIKRAVLKFCPNVLISEDASEISAADALILPGVGSFRAGMEGLKIRNLIKTIKEFATRGKPMLGICLGAQLLLSKGFEFGIFNGLDIIPGQVVEFPSDLKEKIPHIGWNEILIPTPGRWTKTILNSLNTGSDMYFVHSFILKPDKTENILSLTRYGQFEFCSTVKMGNIYGCQFHPEKSGNNGLKIIKSFVSLAQKHD